MGICKYCGITKESRLMGGHVSCCSKNPNSRNKKLERVSVTKICIKCNLEFTDIALRHKDASIEIKGKKYCSFKCSNSHVQTSEQNSNRSKLLKGRQYVVHLHETKKCIECSSYFDALKDSKKKCCSRNCIMKRAGRKGGQISAAKQYRRSKNEIYFSELCKKEFMNVSCNEQMFNGWDADVILQNEKIAVLWNGKWHYSKITKKHSVKQVQNRDYIKLGEIIKAGYTPYIIKDMGSENREFVESEFVKFKEFISY